MINSKLLIVGSTEKNKLKGEKIKMQINKKILSTAITALLILSILAVAAPTNAITTAPTLHVPGTVPGALITTAQTVGTKIEVVGAAGEASNFANVTVYWDTPAGTVLGSALAASDGSYAINVTLPAAAFGNHLIVVNDGSGAQSAAIAIAAKLSTGLTFLALPGDSVTLTGTGFAPASAISLTFDSVSIAPSATTDATGSFTATIVIPLGTALTATPYAIVATDAATHTASTTITINYYVTVTPSGAISPVPPGTTVTIAGRITPSTSYTLTIDSVTISTGASDVNGRLSSPYTLPLLTGQGSHTITLTATGITPSPTATLTVGFAPQITLSAASGVAGFTVTVSTVTPGVGVAPGAFDANANITLSFGTTVVNSTSTDSRFGPTTAAGLISAQFAVPNLSGRNLHRYRCRPIWCISNHSLHNSCSASYHNRNSSNLRPR